MMGIYKKSPGLITAIIALFMLLFTGNSEAGLNQIGVPIKKWMSAGLPKSPSDKIVAEALSAELVYSYISMTAIYGIATNVEAFSMPHIETLVIGRKKLESLIEDFQFLDKEMMVFFVGSENIFNDRQEHFSYPGLVRKIESWFSAFKDDEINSEISDEVLKLYLVQLDILTSVMSHMTFRNHKTPCRDMDSVRFRLMCMYTDVLSKVIKSTSSAYRATLREKINNSDVFNDDLILEMYQNIANFFALWQFELISSWHSMTKERAKENFISAAKNTVVSLNYLLLQLGLLNGESYTAFVHEYVQGGQNIQIWFREMLQILAKRDLTLGNRPLEYFGAIIDEIPEDKIITIPRKY